MVDIESLQEAKSRLHFDHTPWFAPTESGFALEMHLHRLPALVQSSNLVQQYIQTVKHANISWLTMRKEEIDESQYYYYLMQSVLRS
jgi:hypothetical protein